MTDKEKTTGVPIEDDALDKVAGGTDPNLKICDNTYQPGVLNYGAQPTQGSDKSGNTVKMQEDRLNIPINQPLTDMTDTCSGEHSLNEVWADLINDSVRTAQNQEARS